MNNIGSVAVKCKKNYILKWKFFFAYTLPNSSRNPIKKFLHFKMSYTLKYEIQNVRVQQHNLSKISSFAAE